MDVRMGWGAQTEDHKSKVTLRLVQIGRLPVIRRTCDIKVLKIKKPTFRGARAVARVVFDKKLALKFESAKGVEFVLVLC